MKKTSIFFIALALLMIVVLPGCKKEENKVEKYGNNKSVSTESEYKNDESLCQYENEDFDFRISIPVEPDKCHPQRLVGDNYTDIEFFVPTNDSNFFNEVRSYTKMFIVRIAPEDYFANEDDGLKSDFVKMRGKNGKIYAIRFWATIPADWDDVWSDDMKQGILDSFDLN